MDTGIYQAASQLSDNYHEKYQAPFIFNPTPRLVPHSVPTKDILKERENNTQNLDASIAITKGDNGLCSIRQDFSLYGLDEPQTIQYFACGESKFDASFRKHMKQIRLKLNK